MRPHPHDPSPRVAIGVGVIVLAAAVASVLPQLHANTWIFRDGRFYVNVATTITEHLTLDQHAFAASWYSGTLGWNADLDPGWSNVALGRNGEYFPKHPWIHPLIASPVYFALGLPGTLAWNLLMFALIGAGLYRFARAYASPGASAAAVATFVLGTAIVQSAYDFSVDVLMLACFAQGLAAVLAGRGVRAGLLVALCVVIKPTALMLMPALVLTLIERGDRRALGRSLAAGTAALLSYAGINAWMYGRPWWSGYNRTLVTRGGRPVIADHLDAFSVPFAEGFARMWGGYYGLVHTFTVVALGAPGLLVLARRRPLHAIGTTLGIVASLLVFARYEYEGHRFHWPALALAVPSIAISLELLGRVVRRLDVGAIAGLATVAASAAVLPFGPTLEQRVLASGPWGEGAMALGRALPLEVLALESPSFVVVALHLALAGALVAWLVRVVSRVAPPAVAAVAIAGCTMLPEVRDSLIAGGPVAIGIAALALALDRALRKRWVIAGIAAVVAIAALAVLPDREIDGRSGLELLAVSLGERAAIRSILAWLALSVPGVVIAIRRDAWAGRALAILALAALAPGISVRGGAWEPVTALLLAAPAAVAADALGRAIARVHLGPRGAVIAVASVLAGLLVIGGVRRAIAAAEPFRIASERGVRGALVFHDQVPCDFLAWEHMSWECSHFDSGLFGMVGLAVSEGIRVGGDVRELMIVPTGRGGQERRVVWPHVRAGRALDVRWAVPDGQRGDLVLEVLVDDAVVGTIEVPARGDGTVHAERIETPSAGERARLEVRVRPRAGRHPGAVAIDAIWR